MSDYPAKDNPADLRVLEDPARSISLEPFLAPISTAAQGQLESLLQRLGLHALEAPRSMVFTGVDAGAGTTTIAVGLGWLLATRHRSRTLVMGADLRPANRAAEETAPAIAGVRQVLAGMSTLDEAVRKTEFKLLDVLPAGSGSSGFAGTDLGSLLRDLERSYRVVIIDTAPVLDHPETALFTAVVHGTVLVAQHMQSSRKRLRAAGVLVRGSGGSLQGVAVNRVEEPLPSWLANKI